MSSNLQRLVAVAAPLWAGEAEVVRTYWTTRSRSPASDMHWLARQCFKEFWGSGVSKFDRGGMFYGMMKNLLARGGEIDVTLDRHEVADALETVAAEFAHYCAFADCYDAIRPEGSARLNPETLESWPEEDALTALRYRHQEEHGALGMRACKFTEGGYCTLFSEGMALAGRGGIDDKIAAACTRVHADEFGHMLAGIAGIAGIEDSTLGAADWERLGALVAEQLRQRIRMRNQQFGGPLSEARVAAIYRGDIAPIAFDWARAGLA
jgi:hypothetical protein